MINIKYEEKSKEEKEIPFDKLEDGYYLIKRKEGYTLLLLSITSATAHFHKGNSKYPLGFNPQSSGSYNGFYEMVGKIEDFDITNIKLEED